MRRGRIYHQLHAVGSKKKKRAELCFFKKVIVRLFLQKKTRDAERQGAFFNSDSASFSSFCCCPSILCDGSNWMHDRIIIGYYGKNHQKRRPMDEFNKFFYNNTILIIYFYYCYVISLFVYKEDPP